MIFLFWSPDLRASVAPTLLNIGELQTLLTCGVDHHHKSQLITSWHCLLPIIPRLSYKKTFDNSPTQLSASKHCIVSTAQPRLIIILTFLLIKHVHRHVLKKITYTYEPTKHAAPNAANMATSSMSWVLLVISISPLHPQRIQNVCGPCMYWARTVHYFT
jgi:hypothetical protein